MMMMTRAAVSCASRCSLCSGRVRIWCPSLEIDRDFCFEHSRSHVLLFTRVEQS